MIFFLSSVISRKTFVDLISFMERPLARCLLQQSDIQLLVRLKWFLEHESTYMESVSIPTLLTWKNVCK